MPSKLYYPGKLVFCCHPHFAYLQFMSPRKYVRQPLQLALPPSGVTGSPPSSSHLLSHPKTLQGLLCYECEELPRVPGRLGGAEGEHV